MVWDIVIILLCCGWIVWDRFQWEQSGRTSFFYPMMTGVWASIIARIILEWF